MEKNFVEFFDNKMEGLIKDKEQLENEMNNYKDKNTYIYKSFENDYKVITEELNKILQEKNTIENLFKEKEELSNAIENCKKRIESLEQRKQECLETIKIENVGIEKNYIVEQYEKDLEQIEKELGEQEEFIKDNSPKIEEIENNISKYRKQYNIKDENEIEQNATVKNENEKVEQKENEKREEDKNIPFFGFYKGNELKTKNKIEETPKSQTFNDSISSKILVSINEGKLQYQYENDIETVRMYDIVEYNKKVKNLQQREGNVYDPFLKEFLIENKDVDLLNIIRERLGYKNKSLEIISDLFVYDMAETENLGFKARRQLRKMVKMLKNSGLNVENEESLKFSFKNDILKGIGNLFKGTMNGIAGKTETQTMLHASRQQDLANEQMEELLKRDRNNDWVKIKYPTEKNVEKVKEEKSSENLEMERMQNDIIKAKRKIDGFKKSKMKEIQNSREDNEQEK